MLRIDNNNSYKSPSFRGLNLGPKAAKAMDKIGAIKSPGQRFIFGAAALAFQPALDKLNPWVDKETADTSAKRSVAKAIVSTATGVIIREGCIVGTNALLNGKNIAKKLPQFITKDKNHSSAVIGTLMGLAVMMFTNFLIDAPLTNKLTNFLLKNKEADKKQAPQNNGASQPKTPAPSFSQNPQEQLAALKEKIRTGELPPMSQVNMEALKWVS